MGYSRQAIFNTAGTVMSSFCQWLIIMIIPKITNYSEAGVFAAAISICSMLNIVATFSLNQYQISDQYRRFDENDYRVTRLVTITISFLCIIPISIFMGYDAEQIWAIILYMVFRNFLHFAYIYTATLQFYNKLDYVGICAIIEGIISLASFVSVYYITENMIVSVFSMALFGGGIFLLSIIHGYRKYTKSSPMIVIRNNNVNKLLKIGLPLLFAAISPLIITAMPKLILQYYWGDNILGIFSTISSPTIVIPMVVTSAFVPFIVYFSNVARKGDMSLMRHQYSKLMVVICGIGVIALAISLLSAKFFFNLIYGSDLDQYMDYFHILVLGVVLYSIGMCGTTVLITKEQGKVSAYAMFITLIASVILFFVMIPDQGIEGAAYGLLYSYALFAILISICVYAVPLRAVRLDNDD